MFSSNMLASVLCICMYLHQYMHMSVFASVYASVYKVVESISPSVRVYEALRLARRWIMKNWNLRTWSKYAIYRHATKLMHDSVFLFAHCGWVCMQYLSVWIYFTLEWVHQVCIYSGRIHTNCDHYFRVYPHTHTHSHVHTYKSITTAGALPSVHETSQMCHIHIHIRSVHRSSSLGWTLRMSIP